jgi:hypothetical protein
MLWLRFRGFMGRVSVVGIVNCYGLDGPEIESRWGRDSLHPSRQALGPIQPPVSRVSVFIPGVKQPGRGVDNPPPSSTELKVRVVVDFYTSPGLSCCRLNFKLSFTSSSFLLMQVRCQCSEIWVRPEISKFDSLTWEEALPSCAVFYQYLLAFKKFCPSVLHTKIILLPTFSPEDFSHFRCPLSL